MVAPLCLAKQSVEQDFGSIHPWAIYLLYGEISDSTSGIIAVDYEAIAKSNTAARVSTFNSATWIGFNCKSKDERDSFDFKYMIVKKYKDGRFLIKCAYKPIYGSGAFSGYLTVKKDTIEYNNRGKKEKKNVIVCCGFSDVPPAVEAKPQPPSAIKKE